VVIVTVSSSRRSLKTFVVEDDAVALSFNITVGEQTHGYYYPRKSYPL